MDEIQMLEEKRVDDLRFLKTTMLANLQEQEQRATNAMNSIVHQSKHLADELILKLNEKAKLIDQAMDARMNDRLQTIHNAGNGPLPAIAVAVAVTAVVAWLCGKFSH